MNTYYNIQLTEQQRELLFAVIENRIIWRTKEQAEAWQKLVAKVKEAEAHPNLEDVYEYEAKHTGFKPGDKVMVEATVDGVGRGVIVRFPDACVPIYAFEEFVGLRVPSRLVNHMES